MDEDITIINKNTRNEKIKNFFVNNTKKLIIALSAIVLIIFGYFIYEDLKKKNKIKLANRYNLVTIKFISGDKNKFENELIDIVNEKDRTYSPLALYFLIDNNIVNENKKINELFDVVINETSLEEEIKNLVIYKKALFNSDFESENNLIQILSPVINSDSVWRSHALYLMAEYFYYKNQKQKSKDFFNQILILENSNPNIKIETQKRLNRDFSD
jgi:predicted negative regulator of RcsB-dependent stress response